ncbi:PQQ-dependent sugar dehydrogenase [Alcaligenes endophyticus]|uniref:PQQ-dependent sugar dehydrogenase n=1 Tax=Alcaligenes endophyticus TaxID=1929088 RepID=A0ABT8EJJ3_9BURK|nr:PQQ-dependent sugar dehydrogenase [Alcaligenes endophyticus]MCX5591790.1 PQQ-dependent sugar dehydrogenase [Alcaligenes endophyticus]MDN4121467.1 PQQ-dependent sugar dehydrogenase [Alcaligenes endophyticus]
MFVKKFIFTGCLAASLLSAGSFSWAQEKANPATTLSSSAIEVSELAQGLEHPWGMAFLPNNAGILITERPGRLRLWTPEQGLSAPLAGLPKVHAVGQGGLLDIALAPDFFRSRRVYIAYAETRGGTQSATTVGYGVLSNDHQRIEAFRPIFRQEPALSNGLHYGARLVFDPAGRYLYIALGENNARSTAQDLDKLQGKVVRITPDGRIPRDNPYYGRRDARTEIWSYGHRNPQGAAWNPWTQELWVHEHGPQGGDEINRIFPTNNYGWPLVSYGVNYDGQAIPEAVGQAGPQFTQPLYYWEKSPAISGMAFYDHERFPQWQHSLFIGALKDQALLRLELDGERILREERLLSDLGNRIRDVRVGPDGYVYVLTDEANGKLLRIHPVEP